jgi:hypothetical protein
MSANWRNAREEVMKCIKRGHGRGVPWNLSRNNVSKLKILFNLAILVVYRLLRRRNDPLGSNNSVININSKVSISTFLRVTSSISSSSRSIIIINSNNNNTLMEVTTTCSNHILSSSRKPMAISNNKPHKATRVIFLPAATPIVHR